MKALSVSAYLENPDISMVTRNAAIQSNWPVYIRDSIGQMKYSLSTKSTQTLLPEKERCYKADAWGSPIHQTEAISSQW